MGATNPNTPHLASDQRARLALLAAVEKLTNLITAGGRIPVDTAGMTIIADVVNADMEQVTGSGGDATTLHDLMVKLYDLYDATAAGSAKLYDLFGLANAGQNASSAEVTTSGAAAVTAIAADATAVYRHQRVINTGTADGEITFDGGTVWHFVPAVSVMEFAIQVSNTAVQMRRAGDTDLDGCYVSMWRVT